MQDLDSIAAFGLWGTNTSLTFTNMKTGADFYELNVTFEKELVRLFYTTIIITLNHRSLL